MTPPSSSTSALPPHVSPSVPSQRPRSSQAHSSATRSLPSLLLHEDGPLGWHVETGFVDVYAVRLRSTGGLSRRQHLCRVSEGEALFRLPAPQGGWTLLATGTHQTRLRPLHAPAGAERPAGSDVGSDRAAPPHPAPASRLADCVDRWVHVLQDALDGLPPQNVHVLDGPCRARVAGDTCIGTRSGLLWAEVPDVPAVFRDEPIPTSSRPTRLPLGPQLWLRFSHDVDLDVTSTQQVIDADSLDGALRDFHTFFLRGVRRHVHRTLRREQEQLQQAADADSVALSSAYAHLRAILHEEAVAPTRSPHPLVAACEIVGRALDVEVHAPPGMERNGLDRGAPSPIGDSVSAQVERIARHSTLRLRKIALRGSWWTQDAGPFVGFLTGERGAPLHPVALVPASGTYHLHDPVTGSVRPVDAALDQQLHLFGYSFYRPFADVALKAWDVFLFGARACKRDFLTIALMGIAGGILGLVPPLITGFLYDSVIPEADRGQLGQLVSALLVCALATGLFGLVRGLAILRVESRMEAAVQSAVWDRLLKLPPSFFRQFSAGNLAARAGGISGIRQLLSGATISSILSGVFSVFQVGLLFYYDASLAVWAVLAASVALLITLAASYAQLHYQRQVAEVRDQLAGQVLQYVTGITKLRVAGAESRAFRLWAECFSTQRSLQVKAQRIANGLASFNAAFPALSLMLVFGIMVLHENATMPTGDFVAFSAALGTFTSQMLAMTGVLVSVLRAIPLYEQAKPILDALPETSAGKAAPGPLSGRIDVQHVSFRYDPAGAAVLKDVSLRVEPGEFVALVGPSGSGKSTLLRLLLGFERPESGSIYYDEQDLSSLDLQAVRRQMGVVLQDSRLLPGDLLSNISVSETASVQEVWRAVERAGLADDVRAMPMRLHTVVQGGGITLSGGQRQRVLIARALLSNPRLLLLDEATSALDNRTQTVVTRNLEHTQATRIVSAHRLSTIARADRIYVLDQGEIVQQGTYESLLNEGGLFATLVHRQTTEPISSSPSSQA